MLLVALVTSNQCRGFSKPRAGFSYEGFEKPSSSGYEYPAARALWHWLLLTNAEVSQNLVQDFLMKVLRNLLLLDMSIQKHVLFLANILCTNNPHTACANPKVFVRTA